MVGTNGEKMAKLLTLESETKTVQNIYQHYKDNAQEWRRPHLGASIIGRKCAREIWYKYHWCLAPEHSGRVLRLFETGHLAEPRLARNLRDIGIEIYDMDPSDPEKQIHYSDPDIPGFSGSLDGIGRGFPEAPKTWHVLEFKTTNTRGFKKLQKDGVQIAKPEHYAQMQMYMHWSKLTRAYYFSICKETDEIYGERVKKDPAVVIQIQERAMILVNSASPPDRLNDDPIAWDCRFCDFKPICHLGRLPEINCRTCAHSTPGPGRAWPCTLIPGGLKEHPEEPNCKLHIYIPALVPRMIVSADSEAGTVTYERGLVNGPGYLSSEELKEKIEVGE